MPIVRKEFDYDEAPMRMTDREIQQAMVEQRSDYIPPRQVEGRMDDIPIQGVVHEHPQDKVIMNVPIYLTPAGFVCGECNNYMATDGFPRDGKANVFCTNLYCSQNLITKIITLPFSETCIVSPSDV